MTLCWPVATFFTAAMASLRDRPLGPRVTSKRLGAYYSAALRHNALPDVLQRFHARAGMDPALAPHIMFDRDGRVWRALNALRGADGDDVQDKARFAEICARHQLPTVPVIAAFRGGASLRPIDRERASGRSLFVKALSGQLGAGAAIWRYGPTGYSNEDVRHATLDDLLADLSRQDCIVQPLMRDNAALRAAGSDGLSSLRLVTLCTGPGEASAACALLLLAKGMLSQNGQFFGVDIADGALDTWFDEANKVVRSRSEFPEAFPLSEIAGWDGLVELACHAHAVGFDLFATLGWDIVLTDEGPLLLEANQGWGMSAHQFLGAPMGLGPIGAAAEKWLAQVG
jgi:hypothetical protein